MLLGTACISEVNSISCWDDDMGDLWLEKYAKYQFHMKRTEDGTPTNEGGWEALERSVKILNSSVH